MTHQLYWHVLGAADTPGGWGILLAAVAYVAFGLWDRIDNAITLRRWHRQERERHREEHP